MIHGIGTDIVRIGRVQAVLDRHGTAFARRILHADELDEFQASRMPARLLAKRFAAKEALVKALGTGLRDGVILPDIAIDHDAAGQPRVRYQGRVGELVRGAGISGSMLSLSDEQDYVVAFAVLVRRHAETR